MPNSTEEYLFLTVSFLFIIIFGYYFNKEYKLAQDKKNELYNKLN